MIEQDQPDAQARVSELTTTLTASWPELFVRLGGRAADYVDAAIKKAANHKISSDAGVARFVNLCCALGPNFENKPENEWALALLSDDRLEEWVKMHQLVVRATSELTRRPQGNKGGFAQLLQADRVLIDIEDARQRAASADVVTLARIACDIDTFEIRLLDVEWRREYRKVGGSWQLAAVEAFETTVRMGLGKPAVAVVCVLTSSSKQSSPARLQIRLATQFQCTQDRHPLASFAGSHGLWQWRGHPAKAVSWQVFALPTRVAPPVQEILLAQETEPDTSLLTAASCGLRDEGVPTGTLQTYVWAYPAEQFLFSMLRKAGPELTWPSTREATAVPLAAGATTCRYERDGVALQSKDWARGIQEGLQQSIASGLEKMFVAWQGEAQNASMRATCALLTGAMTFTWGWREGAGGLAGRPLMRVVGELNVNHVIDLEFAGEITMGVSRSRVRLRVRGNVPMNQKVAREDEPPGLLEVLLPVVSKLRLEFKVDFEPFAVEDAAMWSMIGGATGSLTGEIGLRPKLTSSGWQWYARMASEAVTVQTCLFDPLLGQTYRTIQLLPAVNWLDWSYG
jgi:hypothetical protein